MWEIPPAELRHGFLSCNRLLGSFKMYACPHVFRAVPHLLELIALLFFAHLLRRGVPQMFSRPRPAAAPFADLFKKL
jgi:hypothetical protein